MLPLGLEGGAPFLLDQPRRGIQEAAVGIGERLAADRLEEQRPARAEALQDVVGPRRGGDELGLGGAFEIGAAEDEALLEAAVLVEHHAGRDQRRPRQVVGKAVGALAVFV
jgi:hypothetical protein